MTEIRKFGLILPISDEQMSRRLSDQERANLEQQRQERLAETRVWLDKMATIRSPLALKVLELHKGVGTGICDGCDWNGHECEQPEWPCSTVRLIAKHFGRPAPEWVELP